MKLRGAEAVERADDADADIPRQAAAFALEPLAVHDEAAGEVRAGGVGDAAAERFYLQATQLQPENPDTWWELGLFRQIALGNQCSAYFALNAAYTLDPKSNRFTPTGPLAVAAAAVNDPKNPACGR